MPVGNHQVPDGNPRASEDKFGPIGDKGFFRARVESLPPTETAISIPKPCLIAKGITVQSERRFRPQIGRFVH